jgi:hypothetical protein
VRNPHASVNVNVTETYVRNPHASVNVNVTETYVRNPHASVNVNAVGDVCAQPPSECECECDHPWQPQSKSEMLAPATGRFQVP